jgi:hypothetical protein
MHKETSDLILGLYETRYLEIYGILMIVGFEGDQ